MNPLDLARKHFKEYRQTPTEIKPQLCPFCNGGHKQDQFTFAMHKETGVYNCLRGSCNVRGSFRDILTHYGEEGGQNYELSKPKEVTFVAPKVNTSSLSQKSIDYLTRRGFTQPTWEAYGVSESRGTLVFPYYEGGKLVLIKYRKPEKYTGDGQKAWREKGGKAVFWGIDLCDMKDKHLVITEGEYDTLALYEAGVRNVVSVPSGAEDLSCVEHCWDWLQKFESVCIWPDNDTPGQEMARKLIAKLGPHRCYVVQSDYKDANEALYKAGPEVVKDLVRTAKPVPMAGLVRLTDVEGFDLRKAERIKSSFGAVNKIVGGYMAGTLSVWTGVNSSGKSTLLSQEMLEVVEQGHRVCVYSGEMPMPIFRWWVDLQAAGADNLVPEWDEVKQDNILRVSLEVQAKIRAWYQDKFYVYDSLGGTNVNNLLEVFGYAAKRYGCKVFLVDNLMMMTFSETDRDFYRKQSEFVKQLKQFAQTYSVHLHLVAHPRKASGRLTKMDIMGSGDITNIADNVFSVHRVPEEEREKEKCDAYLDVFKNRLSGQQEVALALLFDIRSKRYYLRSEKTKQYRKFGWEVTDGLVGS
jgi:twinkle protein